MVAKLNEQQTGRPKRKRKLGERRQKRRFAAVDRGFAGERCSGLCAGVCEVGVHFTGTGTRSDLRLPLEKRKDQARTKTRKTPHSHFHGI